MATHLPVFCDVATCRREAMRWFDAQLLWSYEYLPHTFYLCDEHCADLSPNDDFVAWLNPLTRTVTSTELAVYACSSACRECNGD